MKEIKNKIISISGEPVSGKSTVVKKLKEKYEKEGYKVHIISIGHIFRVIAKNEYRRMYPDRKNANLTDIEADKDFAAQISIIDEKVDSEVAIKGKKINKVERPNDVYIIDSRLAWKNIPASYAIRLTVDEKIAGQRVYEDSERGSEDQYSSMQEAISKTRERKFLEIERYNKRYGVDLTDPENYDLIVDTSYSNVDELAEIIIKGEEKYREEEYYPKYWASPARFLPTQLGRTTGVPSPLGYTIESLAEKIKEEGYDPERGELEIIEANDCKYLIEGNHRTLGALSAGKTLLPYRTTHKEDKFAKDIVNNLIQDRRYMEYLYDYVEGIQYYGGMLGEIKSFKNFPLEKLLSIDKVEIAQKYLKHDDAR